MKGFEEVIKKFPRCAEGYALYAQVNVIFHSFSWWSFYFFNLSFKGGGRPEGKGERES